VNAVEKVISLCDRPGMGVERSNARSARSGDFDTEALVCWLLILEGGIDCERAARCPKISTAAREALNEISSQFLREARSAGYSEYLVNEVRRMFGAGR
jgi:hypothetical protein